MKSDKIIKNLLKIAPDVFGDFKVLFAYLYGSIAVDNSHPFSDLDISVYALHMSLREMLDLEMSLSLEIDRKLKGSPLSDVRIINTLPLVLAGKIITEGTLIYCRDDNARIEYETSIRSAYFDFLPVIHNYQRIYLEQIVL